MGLNARTNKMLESGVSTATFRLLIRLVRLITASLVAGQATEQWMTQPLWG